MKKILVGLTAAAALIAGSSLISTTPASADTLVYVGNNDHHGKRHHHRHRDRDFRGGVTLNLGGSSYRECRVYWYHGVRYRECYPVSGGPAIRFRF